MDLLLKALMGAAVVVGIALLSRTSNHYIAGLLPLFPTFSLIAHYMVGMERTVGDLKATVVFGMWSMLPYLAYLLVLYVLADRLQLGMALAAASLGWLLAAGILVFAWGRLA